MSVKISELPVLDTLADNDVLAGVDTSANVTSKVTLSSLKQYIDTNTTYTGGTNIDITNNVVSAPNVYNKTETDNLLSAKESLANKITSISSSSTNAQYPSAKSVYNHVSTTKTQIEETLGDVINNTKGELDGDIEQLNNEVEELQSEIDSLSMIYNAFPTESDEDESMTLDGTAEVKFKKFDLKGNTSQNGTPTPSSPIPVNVVSGDNEILINGTNLVDLNELINLSSVVTHTWANDVLTVSNTSGTYRFAYVDITNLVKNNPNKILRLDYDSVDFSQSNAPIVNLEIINNGSTSYSTIVSNTGAILTYTIPSNTSGITQVRLRFASNNSSTSQAGTIVITKPILHFGNTKIPYEPYQGDTYNIDLPVENLIDTQYFQQGSINTSGVDVSANTNARGSNYIPVQPNTSYTISANTTIFDLRLNEYKSDKTHVIRKNQTNTKSLTITTGSETYYIRWNLNYNNSTATTQEIIDSLELQLEKGSKVNSYTPFGTTPIELCKIGNYQDYFYKDSDKWYLHKEIGKVVLNGSETWGDQYEYGWRTGITGIKQTTSSDNSSFAISNYYQSGTQSGVFLSDYGISNRANNSQIIIKNKDIANSTDFKAWLSTHNTEVYYVLETPTNTEITYQPLIDQLNAIEQAQSKENQTNISQVNNDLPFIISAEAILSLKNVLDRVTLLES